MQVPQRQGCARGHATFNTELDTVFLFPDATTCFQHACDQVDLVMYVVS